MQVLLELRDKDFPESTEHYQLREATRMIAVDENGQIPILFVSHSHYHKLPGGGIEDGESKEIALERELLEETNCIVEIDQEVGKVVEFRSAKKMKWKYSQEQHSYCYLGRVLKNLGQPEFTEEEREKGFQLKWMSLDDAIQQLERDQPDNMYETFIRQRDLAFLKEAKKLLM